MTKKDFEAIAAVFNRALVGPDGAFFSPGRPLIVGIAKGIAEHAFERNPRFQRGRFLKACGLTMQEY